MKTYGGGMAPSSGDVIDIRSCGGSPLLYIGLGGRGEPTSIQGYSSEYPKKLTKNYMYIFIGGIYI
jgi:hypothetical protein